LRSLRVVLLATLCVLSASNARADTPPNMWDLGKKPDSTRHTGQGPDAGDRYRRHVAVERDMFTAERLFGPCGHETPSPVTWPLELSARVEIEARSALDDARDIVDGTPDKDAWLRYDQAWVLMKRRQPALAIPLLEQLTKDFDGTFFVEDVWERLAQGYVCVERATDEIHAYDEVLSRSATAEERLTPLLNQGEAMLRVGNAVDAVTQFQEVLRLSATVPNGNDVGVLAQWDLALAFDRSRDPRAVEAARTAVGMDRQCIGFRGGHLIYAEVCPADVTVFEVPPGLFPVAEQNRNVYFVPEYERQWYVAVGYEALARQSANVGEQAEDLRHAEKAMMAYIRQATFHGGDKWIDLAQKRLEDLRKRRAGAQKRAGIDVSETDNDVSM
jgi:hypothetical protein